MMTALNGIVSTAAILIVVLAILKLAGILQ